MALAIDQEFIIWTLIVTISVFIVSIVAIAFHSGFHRRLKRVALVIHGMKGAVELCVIAESARLALHCCAECREESTNVSAR